MEFIPRRRGGFGAAARAIGRNFRHPAFLSVFLAVVVAGIAGAAILHSAYLRVLDDARDRAEVLARLLEEITIRNIEATDLVLQGVAAEMRLARLPPHDPVYRSDLQRRLRYLPAVRSILVIGPDGTIIHDTRDGGTHIVSLADRDYFTIHRENGSTGLHIGKPLQSRLAGEWFVPLTRRIDLRDGTFGGVVLAVLDPPLYDRFFATLELNASDGMALLHADGTVIAREPKSLGLVGTSIANLRLFTHYLPNSPQGTYDADGALDDTPSIVSYRRVGRYPLVVSIALGRHAALADWREFAYFVVASFAVLSTLAVATTWIVVERSRERNEVRRRALATRKLEILGQMSGGIAHDIKNLIASLYAGLNLADRNAGDAARVRHYLGAMREVLDRAERLVSGLRTFTKHRELGLVETDVNELLRRLEPILRQAAGPGVSLRVDLAPDLPRCRVDQAHFDAKLLNLILNARDAMPDGGTIEIATRRWTEPPGSLALKPGPYVRVTVRDTGSGMAPAVLDRLFEPFVTTKESGTGLGLAQIYAVMQHIGGDVRIDSKEGQGTTVDHLLFPSASH